jgi:hypothetical protein
MKAFLARLPNSTMTLLMLAIFVAMLAVATQYPPEARFMPFVVGLPAVALLLLQLVLDARARRRAAADIGKRSDLEETEDQVARMVGHSMNFEALQSAPAEPELSPDETVHRELVMWGYFLGFIGGILLFGFWIAIPVFLVAFLRFQAKATWRIALMLGLGATIVLFLVFERGLKVQVHRGFVTQYVLDRLEP